LRNRIADGAGNTGFENRIGRVKRAELADDGEDLVFALPSELDELALGHLHDLVLALPLRLALQNLVQGLRVQLPLLLAERMLRVVRLGSRMSVGQRIEIDRVRGGDGKQRRDRA
jgi:hypothetical protein